MGNNSHDASSTCGRAFAPAQTQQHNFIIILSLLQMKALLIDIEGVLRGCVNQTESLKGTKLVCECVWICVLMGVIC